MDDSDDYFDDLILDDAVIAALDKAETQHTEHRPPPSLIRRDEFPPAKRRKTEHVPLKRGLPSNDFEDLPEISIQGDDSYQVAAAHAHRSTGVIYRPSDSQSRSTRPVQARASSNVPLTRNNTSIAISRPQNLARRSTGPTFHAQPAQPPTDAPRPLQRLPSSHNIFGSQVPFKSSQAGDGDSKAKRDLEILRVKLEETQRNHLQLLEKLQTAEEALYAKEGEVTILRASMSKTSEQHAADIARLQADREAAEAARLQLLKDKREEMERLKTHYTFRQQELETSTRKPPGTISKRLARQIPNTPVRMPSQMRAWNMQGMAEVGFSQTPRGPRFGAIENMERMSSQKPRLLAPAENSKRPMLPGFLNSFVDSPSKRPAQKAADRGKGKQRANLANDTIFFAGGARSSPPSSPIDMAFVEPLDIPMEDPSPVPAGSLSQTPYKTQLPVADFEMDRDDDVKMLQTPEDGEPQDEFDEIEPPNWRDELYHVIFTHTVSHSQPPTMHTLLKSPLASSVPQAQHDLYTSACSSLLEKLGITPRPDMWEEYLREITTNLANLARIFTDNATIPPLSSLFSLLRILSYTIPSFSAALLSPEQEGSTPLILITLCDVIRNHVSAISKARDNLIDELAKEALLFLDALALTLPDELIPQLSFVIRGQKVLSSLLGPTQPTWLILHTVRALTLAAAHGVLFRSLLSFPSTVAGQGDPPAPVMEIGRLPHIEQLSFHLIDPTREGPEAEEMRNSILTFIAILSVSHPDALVTLLQSQTLVPSIIVYLTNATNAFWEDDEELIQSPDKLDKVMRIMTRTMTLLYYMVFSSPEPYQLNHKLHHIPHRQFNGIVHMFIVSMGRFGYADAPSWLGDEDKSRFEQVAEMAKSLLDLVMEGPEIEDVWDAFQPDLEQMG
ncbi:hypothetical protein BDW22DRAFT_1066488 [Trametopsis cervina]|nr:hypothetical protein BDW22DRAFT_1066488 [Trametopsis cervina]